MTKRGRLTPRQREVYERLLACCRDGRPPTVRQLGSALGISNNAVVQHLRALMRKGWVAQCGATSAHWYRPLEGYRVAAVVGAGTLEHRDKEGKDGRLRT